MPTFGVVNRHSRHILSTFGNVSGYENVQSDITDTVLLSPNTLTTQRETDPSFDAKIKRKIDATLPYGVQLCRTRPSRSWCDAETPFGGSPSGKIFTRITANHFSSSPIVSNGQSHDPTRDLALTRLRSKLNDLTHQAKLLAPIAESRELAGLVRQAVGLTSNVVKGLLDIKKRRFRDAYARASDMWLGFNFGVSPTLKDIKNAGLAIASHIDRQNGVMQRVSGSATYGSSASSNAAGLITGFNVQMESVTTSTTKIGYRFTAGVNLKIESANNYGIFDQLGITVPDLVPALWELSAFSWVADYFGTVGTFLEDTFSVDPFTTVYVVENRRVSVKGQVSYKFVPTNTATRITASNCTDHKYEYFEFQRLKLAAIPVRSLRIKSLDEIGLHSVSKLLNLAAVLGKKHVST